MKLEESEARVVADLLDRCRAEKGCTFDCPNFSACSRLKAKLKLQFGGGKKDGEKEGRGEAGGAE